MQKMKYILSSLQIVKLVKKFSFKDFLTKVSKRRRHKKIDINFFFPKREKNLNKHLNSKIMELLNAKKEEELKKYNKNNFILKNKNELDFIVTKDFIKKYGKEAILNKIKSENNSNNSNYFSEKDRSNFKNFFYSSKNLEKDFNNKKTIESYLLSKEFKQVMLSFNNKIGSETKNIKNYSLTPYFSL
jgi:hypothetical protein